MPFDDGVRTAVRREWIRAGVDEARDLPFRFLVSWDFVCGVGEETCHVVRQVVELFGEDSVRMVTGIAIAHYAMACAWLGTVSGVYRFVVFPRTFFQGAPYAKCQEGGAPFIAFYGSKEAIAAGHADRRVALVGKMVCAYRDEGGPVAQVTCQF